MNPPVRIGARSPAPIEKTPTPTARRGPPRGRGPGSSRRRPPCSPTASAPDERLRLVMASGRLSRPTKWELKKKSRRQRSDRRASRSTKSDRAARASTGIRAARAAAVFTAPILALPAPDALGLAGAVQGEGLLRVQGPVSHDCTTSTTTCAPTARSSTTPSASRPRDMSGRTAYITGARLKIGHPGRAQAPARAGAKVIVSTRFPHDGASALRRWKTDYKDWGLPA